VVHAEFLAEGKRKEILPQRRNPADCPGVGEQRLQPEVSPGRIARAFERSGGARGPLPAARPRDPWHVWALLHEHGRANYPRGVELPLAEPSPPTGPRVICPATRPTANVSRVENRRAHDPWRAAPVCCA